MSPTSFCLPCPLKLKKFSPKRRRKKFSPAINALQNACCRLPIRQTSFWGKIIVRSLRDCQILRRYLFRSITVLSLGNGYLVSSWVIPHPILVFHLDRCKTLRRIFSCFIQSHFFPRTCHNSSKFLTPHETTVCCKLFQDFAGF